MEVSSSLQPHFSISINSLSEFFSLSLHLLELLLMKSLIPRIRTSVFQLSFCFQLRVFEGFGGLRRLEVGDGYLVVELLCFVLEVALGPF